MKIICPPIKYPKNKSPEKLIYHRVLSDSIHDFSISSTTKPYKTGTVICTETTEPSGSGRTSSMFVSFIEANPPQQGIGTDLLNVVSRLSKRLGHNGRFFLNALSTFNPQQIPHIFYRKFGMNTESKEINEKLDSFIKSGKFATSKDFDSVYMYYPPISDK